MAKKFRWPGTEAAVEPVTVKAAESAPEYNIQTPEFERRKAVLRRAHRRLQAALVKRGIGVHAGISDGVDGYIIHGQYILSFRGLRQLWLKYFPKRRGKRFEFRD